MRGATRRAGLGLALAGMVATSGAAAARDLVFAHTNDVHGYAYPRPFWGEQLPPERIGERMGGLFSAARAVRLLREGKLRLPGERRAPGRPRDVLFLDAGDWYGGTLHGERSEARDLAALFADPGLGLDATVPGNHAWDFGPRPFLDFLDRVEPRVHVLVANMRYRGGEVPTTEPYRVFSHEGVKVGVLGLLTDGALRATLPERAEGFTVTEEEEALRRWIPEVRRESDYVVLLSHVGFGRDRRKLAMLDSLDDEDPGLNVDLVIDGHSHRDEEVWADADTFVVQADHYGLKLGVVRVPRLRGGGFGRPVAERHLLSAARIRPDQAMLRRHRQRVERRDAVEQEVVVPTEEGLRVPHLLRTDTEALASRMGDLVCAAFRRAAARAGHEVDFAIAYHNGVRSGLYAAPGGGITAGRLHAVAPFGDPLVVVTVPGEILWPVLERGVRTRTRMSFGGALAVARELRPSPREWRELESFRVGGEAFDRGATYRIVTDEFMAGWFRGEGVRKETLATDPKDAVRDLLVEVADGRPLTQADVDRLAAPSARLVHGPRGGPRPRGRGRR